MRDIKPIISTILTIIMALGILTSCTVGQQVNQGEKNDGGTEGTIDVKVEDGETDKSTSDDAELLIIEQAKTELSEYLIANNSNVPEYMLYESNGRFVTIRNGEIFDVHDTFDEVWTAILEALTIAENGVDLMENGVYKSNDTNVSALPLSTFVAEKLRKITDTTSITRTIQGNVCIIGDIPYKLSDFFGCVWDVVGRPQNLSARLQKAHCAFSFCDVDTNADHKKSSCLLFLQCNRFSLLRFILARDADAIFAGGSPPAKSEQPA